MKSVSASAAVRLVSGVVDKVFPFTIVGATSKQFESVTFSLGCSPSDACFTAVDSITLYTFSFLTRTPLPEEVNSQMILVPAIGSYESRSINRGLS